MWVEQHRSPRGASLHVPHDCCALGSTQARPLHEAVGIEVMSNEYASLLQRQLIIFLDRRTVRIA